MFDLKRLSNFLPCETPKIWVSSALNNQTILLIDHAHCEKKAASSALSLIYRYPNYPILLQKMSRLAREELRHFEKVLLLMSKRSIDFQHLSPSRYAEGLRTHIRTHEPERLVDSLIIGAFIEARSCERFAQLIPHLDEELATFYRSLLKSEARHFEDYLGLAREISSAPIDERVEFFASIEKELIESPDDMFRFHSGVDSSSRSSSA